MTDPILTPTDAERALHTALARAHLEVADATPDARNAHHRYSYASAEQLIGIGRETLAVHGLALVPTSTRVEADAFASEERGGRRVWAKLLRSCVLLHADGGSLSWSVEWVFSHEKGRPWDKALAAALTSSLAYVYRDVLGIRRDGAEDDDISARDDTGGTGGEPEARAPQTSREDLRRMLDCLPVEGADDAARRAWIDTMRASGNVDPRAAPILVAAAAAASNVAAGREAEHGMTEARRRALGRALAVMGDGWLPAPAVAAATASPAEAGDEPQAVTLARLFAQDPAGAVESARVILEAGKADDPGLVEALAAVIAAGDEVPDGVDDDLLGRVEDVLAAAGVEA